MTLTVETLPLTVTKGRTAVNFELDNDVGPRVASVVDNGTLTIEACQDLGNEFTTIEGLVRKDVNSSMWVIRGRDRDFEEHVVTALDATTYQVYEAVTLANDDEATLFEWKGITTPTGDKLWVRVAAIDPDSGDGVRWAGWCGRESGENFFITEFIYPAFNVRSYATKPTYNITAAADAGGGDVTFTVTGHTFQAGNTVVIAGTTSYNGEHRIKSVAANQVTITVTFVATETGTITSTPIANAYRQRLLTGNATALLETPQNVNRSVGLLARRRAVGAAERVYGHPTPALHLPFWATVAGDPTDTTSFGRVFLVRAEDQDASNPFFKRLRWVVCRDDANGLITMRCHLGHLPRRSAEFGLRNESTGEGTVRLKSKPWGNSCGPTWTPVLETFAAVDNNWWYDCCERHRAYYETSASLYQTVANDTTAATIKSGGVLATSLQGDPTNPLFWGSWDGFERQWFPVLRNYLAKQNDYPIANRLVYHRQTGGTTRHWGGLNQPDREFRDVVPILPDLIRDLDEIGWRNSIYTIWTEMLTSDPTYGWDRNEFRAERPRISETGVPDGRTTTFEGLQGGDLDITDSAYYPQIERASYKLAVQKAVDAVASRLGLGAIYLDVYGASHSPTIEHEAIEPWGGNQYCASIREIIAGIKERLGKDFAVFIESQAEGLSNFDAASDSLPPRPFLHLVWEPLYEALLSGANPFTLVGGTPFTEISDPPVQMRDGNPPMWQCVHNLDQPSYALNIASTLAYHQNSDLLASGGTDDDDWLAANCFGHACTWIVGHKPMAWEERTNIEGYTPIANDQGGTRATNPFSANTLDTNGIGATFMQFYRDLYRAQGALAGKYIARGKMLRPMAVDYTNVLVKMENNPGKDLRTAVQIPGIIPFIISSTFTYYPIGLIDFAFGFQAPENQVPAVLHTMWESEDDGAIAAILINWTGAAAAWQGTFTAANYGLTGTVTVTRKRFGTTDTVVGTSGAASFTVRSAATTGGDVYIGSLPARSITILEFST